MDTHGGRGGKSPTSKRWFGRGNHCFTSFGITLSCNHFLSQGTSSAWSPCFHPHHTRGSLATPEPHNTKLESTSGRHGGPFNESCLWNGFARLFCTRKDKPRAFYSNFRRKIGLKCTQCSIHPQQLQQLSSYQESGPFLLWNEHIFMECGG